MMYCNYLPDEIVISILSLLDDKLCVIKDEATEKKQPSIQINLNKEAEKEKIIPTMLHSIIKIIKGLSNDLSFTFHTKI